MRSGTPSLTKRLGIRPVSDAVVVDANLAFKWLIRESGTDEAFSLRATWEGRGTKVSGPDLLPLEVTNVLHRRVLRGDLSTAQAVRLIEALLASGLDLYETSGLHGRAIQLAQAMGQGAAYDSHYLALAEMLGAELWTADARFFRAARPFFDGVHLLSEVDAPG